MPPSKKPIQVSIPFVVEPEESAATAPEAPPPKPSVPEPPEVPQPLSVSELTEQIRFLLEGRFRGVLVEGEISNLTQASSGHLYFTLKDSQAQIRAVMFRAAASRLAFRPEQGMEVVVRGSLGVYGPRGEYQLQATQLDPKGVGALQLAFEQLRNRLEQEGLFEAHHKQKLPFLPRKIGVVTSPTGAVIHDMKTVLHRRFPGLPLLLHPAAVQGDRAVPELLAGLEYFAQNHAALGVDVVIIGRGGGSLEDLWAFNDERLARAIFAMPLPTISAVGHETDFTIADFVADLRAPTPSAAMEAAVPKRADLLYTVGEFHGRLLRGVERIRNQAKQRLEQTEHRLSSPERAIAYYQQRVDDLDARLRASLSHGLERSGLRVQQADHSLQLLHPVQRVQQQRPHVTQLQERLQQALLRRLEQSRQHLNLQAEALQHLSPLAQLQRGYAMVRTPERRPLRSAQDLQAGDPLEVHLPDGTVHAEVRSIARRDLGTPD